MEGQEKKRALREDRFLLPDRRPGERWVWKPRKKLILMKDAAAAATNAAAKVWPDAEVHEAMCNSHANIRWFSNNAGKFNDGKANRKNSGKDIENGFKNLGHINLVEVQKRKMIQKWKEQYKETVVADHWYESWGRSVITRVETNSEDLSPLRGGIPCDNNAVEGGNGSDKKALDFKKFSLFVFLNEVSTELVENASRLDVKYECPLKNACGKNGRNKSVFTMAYFEHCYSIDELDKAGKPTFLSLQFSYTDDTNDVPRGSMLIAGEHCLNEMRHLGMEETSSDIKAARKYLSSTSRASPGWVKIFKNVVAYPEEVCGELSFDQISNWNKTFHIVRPIVPDNGGPIEKAVRHYVQWLKTECGFPIMEVDEILSKGKKGLVSCTCTDYMHCIFCKHSYLILKKRQIFLGYPERLDPFPVNRNRGAGRPSNVARGGALDKNG
jgi:hypothetical protein